MSHAVQRCVCAGEKLDKAKKADSHVALQRAYARLTFFTTKEEGTTVQVHSRVATVEGSIGQTPAVLQSFSFFATENTCPVVAIMEKRDVEFKTIDGLTLRGDLYPAQGSAAKGPAIVITPGVSEHEHLVGQRLC